jgi:uroporphyrinogen-III decarboxylase
MKGTRAYPTDAEKERVWQDYRDHKPSRVPVLLVVNPRTYILDPEANVKGITMEQAQTDPRTHVETDLAWELHNRRTLHRYCDLPTELPDVWQVFHCVYNIFEAAFFGAEVRYPPGQVPVTEPFLDDDNKRSIFEVDIEHPLEHGFFKECLDFQREMERISEGYTFEGRPVRVAPFVPWTDGPLTVACNLRGLAHISDLIEDPEYADKLMAFINRAAIIRRDAFAEYWGDRVRPSNDLADDSCALISVDMYRERIMPLHRAFYEAGPKGVERSMHLCGDATHLFPTMHEQIGVTRFDTGYPVDHGRLRRSLGPEVEISGGVEAHLLLSATADEVYERAKEILQSGVMEGGRFVMRDANNLPPGCPEENLEAMYAATLDYGRY